MGAALYTHSIPMRSHTPPAPAPQHARRALTCLAAVLCLPNAWAVLGQALPAAPASSATPALRAALASKPGAIPGSLYTTHVTQQSSGTQVTEYATSSGVVFAVSWQGPALPPLETLLGSYFPDFQAQADASRAYRSLGTPLHIQTGTLVVHSSGRMRNFSGHAYDPQLLPNGLNIRDVFP